MRFLRHTLLAFAGVAAGLGLAEGLIRLGHLDVRALRHTLYWVEGDFHYEGGAEVCRPSAEPGRLYELIPGARARCTDCVHPLEKRYRVTDISVNSLGMRGPEPVSRARRSGVFRVVLFGGSNTFGISVSDRNTTAATLQRSLDKLHPGKFEIWNSGINALVTSQLTARAEEVLRDYGADLILLQPSNGGRRAFFYKDPDLAPHFRRDPELWLENLPLMDSRAPKAVRLHRRLVARSALYRFWAASANLMRVGQDFKTCNIPFQLWSCWSDDINRIYAEYGDLVNRREFSKFLDRHPDLPILIYDPVHPTFWLEPALRRPNVRTVHFRTLGKPAEYAFIHPPSYVYDWYVTQLAPIIVEMWKESRRTRWN
ncbi:MAG: hypothetical protein A2X36_09930 [Elusimicrobia bacterium GWA2_69_24]|nr:MAG: hypothetical protein A2X36_09930 [Elusimicrobia bacterium GWA2_69_24]HBL17581.1 hypothetical protein [Elusimicrobiota bacterium]